jgi:hypothetical protein
MLLMPPSKHSGTDTVARYDFRRALNNQPGINCVCGRHKFSPELSAALTICRVRVGYSVLVLSPQL